MPKRYIDLKRTFYDLPLDEKSDIEQAEFLSSFSTGKQVSWDVLLESDRVLIVSEAGFGKTYECKRQQEQLWKNGESAFYLELSALATRRIEEELSGEEKRRFNSWLVAQTERATFFLDSVDELKLTQQSFESTLKRVAGQLDGCLDRACFVFTSRPIAIDRDLVERWFPAAEPVDVFVPEEYFANVAMRIEPRKENQKPEKAPQWRYVALSPLNETQMRTLAGVEGIEDPGPLLTAIEAQQAKDFAKRPLDFIELCGDWKIYGRIRSHRDQIDNNVEVKLRPRQDRQERAHLTAGRAREGVERLALAALLTRRFTFWHGHDHDRGRGDSAIDPNKILLDWRGDEIKALLERPLFGFATYGRVRFHNRSVIEFLAAERLLVLLEKGMAINTLRRLLFAATPSGLSVVRATMQPVAAWIAPHNPNIRADVLHIDPSILLRYADPSSLHLSMKADALEQYVRMYGTGGWRGQRIPALQVHRLSDIDLAPTIAALWKQGIENSEVRETLLEIISAGKLHPCADIAYGAAVDAGANFHSRLDGLVALSQLEDPRLNGLLDELGDPAGSWPGELVSAAVTSLFPGHMSVPQLLGALRRLGSRPREFGGIPSLLPVGIAKDPPSGTDLELLRGGLWEMINAASQWDMQTFRVTTKRRDLVPSLAVLCRMELTQAAPKTALFDAIALVLHLSEEDVFDQSPVAELQEAIGESDHVRRGGVFWALDRLMDRLHPNHHGEISRRLFNILDDRVFSPSVTRDRGWVTSALAEARRVVGERELLLELGIQLAHGSNDRLQELRSIVPLVEDNETLRLRLHRELSAIENPAPEPDWMRDQRVRQDATRKKNAKYLASWKKLWRELRDQPDASFAPDRLEQTAWNLWRAMDTEARGTQLAGWNRGFIERVLNVDVANRMREALGRTWRAERPTLKSERPADARNTYLVVWRMGLAGLYAEAEDPTWAERLRVEEIELALRYALIDLNRLPPWVDDLIRVNPELVESVIGQELQNELADPADQYSMALQEIEHSSSAVIKLFLDRVRLWLTSALAGSPLLNTSSHKHERAIRMLLDHGTDADRMWLASFVRTRLAQPLGQDEILFLLPILLKLDATSAVATMESLASKVEVDVNTVVTEWFSHLFGMRGHRDENTFSVLFSDPSLLLRMSLLAYAHIRTEEDIEREGMHQPGPRDHAQFARSILSNALLSLAGPQAWEAKLQLSRSPLLGNFRDRALAIAREQLSEESDTTVFTEAAVVNLEKYSEFAPMSRQDMAALLQHRLEDIDAHLLLDASPRELWRTIKLERLLRRELSGVLNHMRRSAYVVFQEAATADEKETDVRIRSTASAEEAVIELKLAENGYTFKALSEALEHQLLGRYLASENRRTGCLLISIASDRHWVDPLDQHQMDVVEVIDRLNERARELMDSLNGQVYLSVKALDLRANR